MGAKLDCGALEKAHAFVRDNGSPLARTLAGNASEETSAYDALSDLVAFQNADGGWRGLDSDMAAPLSTISQSWVGLKWRHWLRTPDAGPVDRTVEFLRLIQHPDGYWDEPGEMLEHGPTPWMAPGNFSNQVCLTAATCSRLTLHSRQAGVRFDAALDFLRAAWDGERFPRYNHTHWVSLVVFGLMTDPTPADRDIFEGSARFLEAALAEGGIDTLDVIEIARDSQYAGRPAARLFEVALPKLLSGQANDGGWSTGYGERHRPMATAEAMYVLELTAARGLLDTS